jgi:hypothetical protein
LYAAFCSYLTICTVQQLLHRGLGHGQRRIGTSKRMCVRMSFIVASAALAAACHVANLPSAGWEHVTLLCYVVGATAVAVFELRGRGTRDPPGGGRRPSKLMLRFRGPQAQSDTARCHSRRASAP